jgi:hypothetical protein
MIAYQLRAWIMDFSDITNFSLKTYLERKYKEATVILCFLILLRNYIQNAEATAMSKSEVEKIFNIRCKEFGVNTFRRDYLKRQSGDPKNAIDENSSQKFFLRKEFFVGIDEDQMNAIDSRITNYYVNKFSINKDFTNLLERLLEENNSDKMFKFIESLLRDDQRDENRKGQNFEITSFAILKQFYLMRGFSLNRFSTTFANDGGMDFIGENAIYQATVVMSPKKFQEDIIKTPKTKRSLYTKAWLKTLINPYLTMT